MGEPFSTASSAVGVISLGPPSRTSSSRPSRQRLPLYGGGPRRRSTRLHVCDVSSFKICNGVLSDLSSEDELTFVSASPPTVVLEPLQVHIELPLPFLLDRLPKHLLLAILTQINLTCQKTAVSLGAAVHI